MCRISVLYVISIITDICCSVLYRNYSHIGRKLSHTCFASFSKIVLLNIFSTTSSAFRCISICVLTSGSIQPNTPIVLFFCFWLLCIYLPTIMILSSNSSKCTFSIKSLIPLNFSKQFCKSEWILPVTSSSFLMKSFSSNHWISC